jgi:hypothetical protein
MTTFKRRVTHIFKFAQTSNTVHLLVMPNKTFESILLSDAPLEASINYVTNHLG